ncbi:MAG: orotate phosphoribosyltransferase [Oscillospiraceae bacterium]|jgi:orotate phosphoribosyltransferase|nr:orotate phosphoribosyltransferase [Oscillospiraceae bacterium]
MNKNDFIKFMIECEALLFGDFTLKSGRSSPYFVNTGRYDNGKSLKTLCSYYTELIEQNQTDFNVLYGPAYKGIPLASITATMLESFPKVSFNRKEVKDHGDTGSFLGHIPQNGDRIAIIEDVTTAGTSIKETIELLKKLNINAEIVALFISVDRMEKGINTDISATKQISKEYGIPVYSIIKTSDIVDYLKKSNNEYAEKIQEYLNQYGAKEE